MGFSITRRIGPICAVHALGRLPEGHGCRNVHGHNFYVQVTISASKLTDEGFVIDFADLAPLEAYLLSWSRLEGGLNELFDDQDPTVEHLAEHIADWFEKHLASTSHGRLTQVRVEETESCWAEYSVEPS